MLNINHHVALTARYTHRSFTGAWHTLVLVYESRVVMLAMPYLYSSMTIG